MTSNKTITTAYNKLKKGEQLNTKHWKKNLEEAFYDFKQNNHNSLQQTKERRTAKH
nr:MAG TPA: hypothetical protein [Caudoviricetes sp.]